MKSLWEHDARLELLKRIGAVPSARRPLWGRMTCGRMFRHLAQSIDMATGALHCEPKKLPLRYFPLKQLAIYVLPFAKGLPTAPELLEGDDSCDAARSDLRQRIEAVALRTDAATWPEHPAFGKLTPRAWGVLMWRHIDHHLKQFGG